MYILILPQSGEDKVGPKATSDKENYKCLTEMSQILFVDDIVTRFLEKIVFYINIIFIFLLY